MLAPKLYKSVRNVILKKKGIFNKALRIDNNSSRGYLKIMTKEHKQANFHKNH